MKKIKQLSDSLNLLYYEYDFNQNRFIVDKNSDYESRHKEFIKLTYYLSKHGITFFIDDESNIILEKKSTLSSYLFQYIKNKISHFKNSTKNIYILSDTYVEHAKNLPVIQTVPLKKDIDLKKYDAIIFTSKNGVKAIDTMNSDWKQIDSYTISNKTAKQVKELGGKVAFISNEGHGDEFANELIKLLQGKNVVFLGAKKVVTNLVKILNDNNIKCEHEIVYETQCINYEDKIDIPEKSIIIFSSPSTIKCFLNNVNWKDSFTAISIGKTTAKYFPNNIQPLISETPSLQGCVQKALNL